MPSVATTPSSRSVSVIIPTHNRWESLPTAIDSVLAQSDPVHELFVVDDGSTDGTADKVRQHYPTVKLICQRNHGVSHARNRAIEQASGAWIALLDSDDRWYADKIARQLDALQDSPQLRLCHCDEHWLRNGKRINPRHKHRKRGGEIFEHCLPLCCISPSAVLIHRSLFAEVGLFDEDLPACEDYDLWLRICAREPVLYVDEALLEKTGGHADQLSQRYPAMDQYRLQALASLLRSAPLTQNQRQQAQDMFEQKLRIFCNGARKRGRDEAVASMLHIYTDLLDPAQLY
ncbi:glycosyltransferase family 2 protein [Granulosicoccus sp. 3-233]|uniref:glycosyltransferase family 2 protein n=1 Tax=Granulosicoccus sp. 3-233 TaxID=3417969 RepID=UPI003D3492BD